LKSETTGRNVTRSRYTITNTSLDGYIEDDSGAFDWINADQVHAFITELVRPIGTRRAGDVLTEGGQSNLAGTARTMKRFGEAPWW